MALIRILPETLCNQIAAGEVVERPASVVKELIENALDAGADDVRVEVEKGGKNLIRVSDNGSGMSREDAYLALERHATSKIGSVDDLMALSTLGFRGEALPSIASVSRLLLRTQQREAPCGWELYAEGGSVRRAGETALAPGTLVEVRNLFFNVPARRKFLRSDETELGHVSDTVTKLALGHPHVRFVLAHNQRTLLETRPATGLRERVAALLGRETARGLIEFSRDTTGVKVHGLLSSPSEHRATTAQIYGFINGRYVRDRVVQHALMEGYRTLLGKGRYPVVVLFLEMNPGSVDVNVHPTKHEVRFREPGLIHDLLVAAIRETLRGNPWQQSVCPQLAATPPAPRELPVVQGGRDRVGECDVPYAAPAPPPVPAQPHAVSGQRPAAVPQPQLLTEGPFSRLHCLGAYRATYLVCQDGEDLVLVDQHAAHERVRFEELKLQAGRSGIERQQLLFPEVLELDPRQAAVFGEKLAELADLGFEIEPFGPNAFVVKGYPRLLAGADVARLVRDIAAEIEERGRSALNAEARDAVLMKMACHSAVRAHRPLSPEEIRALFLALDRIDFSAQCPHGRPVLQRLTLAEVERLFRRSG